MKELLVDLFLIDLNILLKLLLFCNKKEYLFEYNKINNRVYI